MIPCADWQAQATEFLLPGATLSCSGHKLTRDCFQFVLATDIIDIVRSAGMSSLSDHQYKIYFLSVCVSLNGSAGSGRSNSSGGTETEEQYSGNAISSSSYSYS